MVYPIHGGVIMTSKKFIPLILLVGLVMAVSGCITDVESVEIVDVGDAQMFRQHTLIPGGGGVRSPIQFRDVSITAEGIEAVSSSGCGTNRCVRFVDANDTTIEIDTYILVSGCQTTGYLYRIPAGMIVSNPIPIHVGSLAREGCQFDLIRDPPAEGIQVMPYRIPIFSDYYGFGAFR